MRSVTYTRRDHTRSDQTLSHTHLLLLSSESLALCNVVSLARRALVVLSCDMKP
jgi:hypothetical protein